MERTDWLDEGFTPADARFLMATSITHHRVSSPNWGEHEVRKLHAELADLQRLGARIVAEETASFSGRRPFSRRRTEAGGGKAA
jgi:hypothetical protein